MGINDKMIKGDIKVEIYPVLVHYQIAKITSITISLRIPHSQPRENRKQSGFVIMQLSKNPASQSYCSHCK